ncbi:hypothetical protein AEST_16460 [Alishewanella aestuarii B11]|uniref:DUF6644 domain-containing protein n=1 Tax=Alishewanella aestuarii B11 TaxID=1197174 RepID=J2IDS0_9ALTE|nr:DUF6644 family protein [Alishewanella aestuarii]EJI85307.1 hypothetical protein AEST_16460 [Alishewanella aestuarii B11]
MLANSLTSLSELALINLIRQSALAYPALSALHILGIALLLGNILLLDLRLLGVLRQSALSALLKLFSQLAGIGLLLAIGSGVLLFSVQPLQYLSNQAFLLKMLLLALALLNLLIVHLSRAWQQACSGGPVSNSLKLTAASSLLLWLTILFAGRWIAFV